MTTNPFIADILAQPAALRQALDHYPAAQIELLRARLLRGDFSRIVLTGMGSSFNAGYPAWLNLQDQPVPALHVNSAELLHYGRNMIEARTLLWVNSQSGRSAEIVRLLEQLEQRRPAFQLSMGNQPGSPMERSADLFAPIHAGSEATVATKTYLNMLATLALASTQLAGGDWQAVRESMRRAADAIETYLAGWQQAAAGLDAQLGQVDQLFILGRGSSLAAVWNGSLMNKEAAKCAFEGMNTADFRHGPMELASQRLTVLMLAGAPDTLALNRELALDVIRQGGRALWLASQPDVLLPFVPLPDVDEAARPLAEILPLQLLSIVMARRNGFEPGVFRNVSKVTLDE